MSEAMLAMVLEIEAGRHKRELAEGFAAARARLIPSPKEKGSQGQWLDAIGQAASSWRTNAQQALGTNPYNNYGADQGVLNSLLGTVGYWPFGLPRNAVLGYW